MSISVKTGMNLTNSLRQVDYFVTFVNQYSTGKQTMKSISLVFLLQALFVTASYSQGSGEDDGTMDLEDYGLAIENRIDLALSETQYTRLHSTEGTKINIRPRSLVINGDTLEAEKIHTRGKSTLLFRRKSLNVKLMSKASFSHIDNNRSFKKFLLLNLSMDRYYCKNRIAFEMMEMLDLFDLYYAFCDMRINGKSEGVFMIIERPEDWAFKVKNAPFLLRRGSDQKIEEIKADDKIDRAERNKYVGYYREIYRSLNKYEGEALYEALQEYLDLEFYMKWLAFNYLVRNGDYADEVFFYIDPEVKKFRIIPWDYDDIFAPTPHEGIEQRERAIGDKLIFSSEDLLDIKIATDPYLYEIYLQNMKAVVEILSPNRMTQVIEKTYAELYPFYSDEEIISNVQYDDFTDASLDNLESYLSKINLLLLGSWNSCLEYEKNNIK